MTGASTHGIKTVPHPVSDLARAKPVYAALLGVAPQTDEALQATQNSLPSGSSMTTCPRTSP